MKCLSLVTVPMLANRSEALDAALVKFVGVARAAGSDNPAAASVAVGGFVKTIKEEVGQ